VLSYAIKGFMIGIANVIPGVSGGTMALMLGIYERLLAAIAHIHLENIKQIISLIVKMDLPALWILLKRLDMVFVGAIGTGAICAIVATSRLITYLITHWHDPIYGFFAGLVLTSVYVPLKMMKRRMNVVGVCCLLCAALLTLATTTSMTGSEKLERAEKKVELRSQQHAATADGSTTTGYLADHSLKNLGFILFASMISISAMILPGISGAFVLLLMGVYFEVLGAIAARDLTLVSVVALGSVLGILIFTRILNYLLERYHDETVSSLVGLMIGSLYSLWPFQGYAMVGGKRIDLEAILPVYNYNFLVTVITFVLAGALVIGFIRYQERSLSSS